MSLSIFWVGEWIFHLFESVCFLVSWGYLRTFRLLSTAACSAAEASHFVGAVEGESDQSPHFQIVIPNETHVIVEWNLHFDAKFCQVVNPVLEIHFALCFIHEQFWVKVHLLLQLLRQLCVLLFESLEKCEEFVASDTCIFEREANLKLVQLVTVEFLRVLVCLVRVERIAHHEGFMFAYRLN